MGDVILFKEDVDQLNSLLRNLVDDAKILSALLVTKDTRVLACQGTLASGDTGALAALLVGSFAATQAIAGLIGETEFDTMSHCGKTRNVVISLIDDDTILASVFDKSSTADRIQSCVVKHLEVLKKALRSIGGNTTHDLFDTGMSTDVSDAGNEFELRADALNKNAEPDQHFSSDNANVHAAPPIKKPDGAKAIPAHTQATAAPGDIKRPPDTEMIIISQAQPRQDDRIRPEQPTAAPAPETQPRESGTATSEALHMSMNYLKNKTREGALYYHHDKAFFKKFFKSSHKKKS